MILNNKGIP